MISNLRCQCITGEASIWRHLQYRDHISIRGLDLGAFKQEVLQLFTIHDYHNCQLNVLQLSWLADCWAFSLKSCLLTMYYLSQVPAQPQQHQLRGGRYAATGSPQQLQQLADELIRHCWPSFSAADVDGKQWCYLNEEVSLPSSMLINGGLQEQELPASSTPPVTLQQWTASGSSQLLEAVRRRYPLYHADICFQLIVHCMNFAGITVWPLQCSSAAKVQQQRSLAE